MIILQNTDNEGVKIAEDKRDDLYKQLMISNAEVCHLQMRVGVLEQELQVHFLSASGISILRYLQSRKSVDLARTQAFDRGEDTRDKQQVFRDASTQTDQGGIAKV